MRLSFHVLIHGMVIAHAAALGVILEDSGKQVKTRYRTRQDPDDYGVDPTGDCDAGSTKEHVIVKDPEKVLDTAGTLGDGNWCQQICTSNANLGLAEHAGAEAGACYNLGFESVKTTVNQHFFDGNTSNPNYNCESSVFSCPDGQHSYYFVKADDCYQMCVQKSDHPLNEVLEQLTGLERGNCKNQQDGDDIEMCNFIGNASMLLFVDGNVDSGLFLREQANKLDGGPDGNDGNGPDDRTHSRSGNGPARVRASAGDNAHKGADNDNADEAQDGGPDKLLDTAHKSIGAAGDDDADDAGERKGSGGNGRPAGETSSVGKNSKTNDQDVDGDDKDGAAENDDASETKESQGDMRPDGKSSSVGKKSSQNDQDHDANVDKHGDGDDDDNDADDDDAAGDSQDDGSDAPPHKAPKSGSRTNSGLFVRKESS